MPKGASQRAVNIALLTKLPAESSLPILLPAQNQASGGERARATSCGVWLNLGVSEGNGLTSTAVEA